MSDFKMPYGAEFSPEKIKIKELLYNIVILFYIIEK